MTRKHLSAILLLAGTTGANAALIHTGLLNYWSLDGNGSDTAGSFAEATGTGADDVAPGGTAGAASIDAAGGLFGGSGVFQRGVGTDGRLAAANSADVNAAGESLSVSLWVQFDTVDTGWQAILGRGEGANYRIAVENGGGEPNDAAGYAGGLGDAWDNNGVNVQDGSWHHIVATTVNGGNTSVYVDGLLEATSVGAANIQDVSGFNGETWIGNNPGSTSRMWDGRIDDVAMWDRALTADDVQQIYNAGLAGVSLAQIPEPSVGLLSLLSLSALLRRRR